MPLQEKRVDVAAEEAARRQSVFREVNENIARLAALATEMNYRVLVCECSDTRCAESLEITASEYEAVRSVATRFIVVPGHQRDAVERVVDRNGRFLVVETLS